MQDGDRAQVRGNRTRRPEGVVPGVPAWAGIAVRTVGAVGVDHTEQVKKQSEIRLEISKDSEQPQALIKIADNGTGFPKSDLDKLLEPYYTTREMGTGIGLSVVKNIIEVHKGQLNLKNDTTSDKSISGAIVEIILPKSLDNNSEKIND